MCDRRKYFVCGWISVLLACFITAALVHGKKEVLQQELAEEVFRFHVLAASDSEKDQYLKMEVKQAIIDFMEQEIPEGTTLQQTKDWAKAHLSEIEAVGQQELAKHDCEDTVNAEVTRCAFPEKTYGDITFPSGKYEALRVELGAGEGQNWWCVLYPNLCFVDAIHAVVPEEGKEQLEEVLSDDAYEMVTSKTIFKIKWFFF